MACSIRAACGRGCEMLRIDEITDIVLKSTLKASSDYVDFSGDQTIHDFGVEFLISAQIARGIIRKARGFKKREEAYVTLESPFRYIRKDARVSPRRGRPRKSFEGKSRVDLIYYDRRGRAVGVFEVKRHLSYANLEKDVCRIRDILSEVGRKKMGSVKFGCLASIREINNRQKKYTSEIAEEIKQEIVRQFPSLACVVGNRRKKLPKSMVYRNDRDEKVTLTGFEAVCFYITLKN